MAIATVSWLSQVSWRRCAGVGIAWSVSGSVSGTIAIRFGERIVVLDLALMGAGEGYRGDVEERVKAVIAETYLVTNWRSEHKRVLCTRRAIDLSS